MLRVKRLQQSAIADYHWHASNGAARCPAEQLL